MEGVVSLSGGVVSLSVVEDQARTSTPLSVTAPQLTLSVTALPLRSV